MIRVLAGVGMGLVGLAIGAGIVATGGPQEGRAERFDRDRISDLRALNIYLRCGGTEQVLPARLDDPEFCPKQRDERHLFDPETGQLYSYFRLSDTRFEVCARLTSRRENARILFGFSMRRAENGDLCVKGERESG